MITLRRADVWLTCCVVVTPSQCVHRPCTRYTSGVTNELYAAEFPLSMMGLSFETAAEIAYVECRAVLIAVQSAASAAEMALGADESAFAFSRHTRQSTHPGGDKERDADVGVERDGSPPPSPSPSLSQSQSQSPSPPSKSVFSDATSTLDHDSWHDMVDAGPVVELFPQHYEVMPGDLAIMVCAHQNSAEQVRQGSRASQFLWLATHDDSGGCYS